MVDRPADVLPMDKTKPVKVDGFIRFDRACRRTPGLGIFICLLLIRYLWTERLYIGLAVFALVLVAMVVEEFATEVGAWVYKRWPSL